MRKKKGGDSGGIDNRLIIVAVMRIKTGEAEVVKEVLVAMVLVSRGGEGRRL